MAKVIYFSLLILTASLFQGCKTTSGLKTPETNPVAIQQWKNFTENQTNEPYLEMKRAQLVVELNKKIQKSSANIQIIRDSAMHISVQPFPGIELLKIEFTKNQVCVFNKMNSQRYEATYSELSSFSGISLDLNACQSIFSHRPYLFLPFANLQEFKSTKDENQFILSDEAWEEIISVDKQNVFQSLALKNKAEEKSLEVKYSDFRKNDGFFFPFNSTMNVQNKNLMLKFEVNLSRISHNQLPALRFEEKDKYMLVPISSFLSK